MCYQRITQGEQPACTAACPTQATIFGERDELLRIAHDRVRREPGKYIQTVYGEHEFGGTSVLYISDIDLSFLSYGSHPSNKPLPAITAPAMEAVPFTFVGMGVVMYGLNWIIGRRMKLNDKSKRSAEDHHE